MVTTLPQAVHMSVLMLAIYRLPAVVVCTQPWLVTLCNMPPFLVMLLRIYGSSYPAGEDCDFQFNQLNATFLEVFNLVVVSMGSYVLEKTLRSQVKQSILISKAATELTAASSLLQLTCDAVVELDEDLRLTTPAHDLGAMLLRNRQTSSLLGKKFVDLVPTTTEAERAEEILRGKAASDEIAAQAFHTRLVDSCSSKFRTEVFHVQYRRLDGHLCHLIGLRDFTDQGSLAGRNAKDSTEEAEEPEEATVAKASSARPRIVADDTRSEHSVESQGPRKVFVQIDMEKLQVVACSVSASSLSAQALDDLFGPAEIDFLKQVWTQVQALDSRNQLDNKELNFGNLQIRWEMGVYAAISGSIEVTRTAGGALQFLMHFFAPASPSFVAPIRSRRSSSRSPSVRSSRSNRNRRSDRRIDGTVGAYIQL